MGKKKKSAFGTLLKLGALAAAGAAVYAKRNEIKGLLADAAERIFPDDAEIEPVEETLEPEPEIVIDAVKSAAEAAEAPAETEETEEAAPEE